MSVGWWGSHFSFCPSITMSEKRVHFSSTNNNKFFVAISENRVYCNNKHNNYQIWYMLIFIITFVCVLRHKNKKKRMLYAEYFYHPFCAFSRCSAVVPLSKIRILFFCFDYFHCWSVSFLWLFWFDLCRKVSWSLLLRWTKKVILLVKWLIFNQQWRLFKFI